MAQKKGGGSTRNGRDSKPKMLGVKAFGGEMVSAGSTPATTSASAKTTLCSQQSMVMSTSLPRVS